MEEKATYLVLMENGKLRKTDNLPEADYVRIPVNQYITITEWNNLIEKYQLLRQQYKDSIQRKNTNVKGENEVAIPKEEYNGIQKMFRILRDRSLQEIEKSKADPHGYTLKYADERPLDRLHPDQRAYFITKMTPLSLRMNLETAYYMIKKDLREYYNFLDNVSIKSAQGSSNGNIKPTDLYTALSQRKDPNYNYDFYVSNSDYGKMIKKTLDNSPQIVSFGPIKIVSNIGQGIYEISYWASAPI